MGVWPVHSGIDLPATPGPAPPVTPPRFVDNGNGTIYDTVVNITLLKDANCFGLQNWVNATAKTSALANGQCGLSDGSKAGDWHLPSESDMLKFTSANSATFTNLIFPIVAGFLNVQTGVYWSSDTYAPFSSHNSWFVNQGEGFTGHVAHDYEITTVGSYTWPVRGQ